ncbi:unnamed protein product [Schistosoma turkestanicum]|nr:unnamed protein product [Schistosoma turkestanicum]
MPFYFSAPNHFTDDWLQKLNHDAEINWRLKVSNLKKILKAVVEFLNERIEDRISVQFLPNLQEIAEHENEEDTFRLLQLILACAVNCDNKQTYIQTIMGMEETVQQALMEAIQQLMSTRLNIHDTMDYEDRLCKTIEQYKTLLMEKDKLTEQCKTLQQEVFSLQEEKSNHQSELNRFRIYFESLGLNPALLASTTTTASATLSSSSSTLTTSTATTLTSSSSPTSTMPPHTTNAESIETGSNHSNNNNNNPTVNISLLNQISDSIASNANVLMSPTVANVRINHLQNQLTKLRDELYRTECDKEELKIQLAEITAQNQELKQKCTILTAKAEETLHLKDELDIAREEALNVVHLSKTIEQLRKHADEVVSLRLRCTQLETDNEICLKRLTELEQETRLNGNIRTQIKTQARLQVENAQYLTNESIRRAELAEQNLLKIRQELINVTREKECIFAELTRLKSCCEGLQSCVETSNYGTPAMQSQMSNLQEELSRLRTSVYSNEIIMGSGHSINEIGFDVTITPTTTTTTPNADSTTNSSILGGDDHNVDKNYYYSRRTHSTTNSVTTQNKLMNTHDNARENNNCSSTTTQSLPLSSTNSSQHHLPIDDRNHSNHDANTLLYTDLLTKLTQKETDYIEMEQKYRGYLWKAREVIRLLERQYRQHQHDCAMYKEERKIMMTTDSNNTTNNNNDSSSSSNDKMHQEIAQLRELLVEKERVIEKLETHHEQVRRHREAEERILLTAWYNLVIKSTRTSIESDLKQSSHTYPETLNSDTTTTNNNSNNVLYNTENNLSFLARQRNIHLKPSIDLTSLVTARK